MVIDFIIYCALAYGTIEFIKYKFQKADDAQRYTLFLSHMKRKCKEHRPPANVLQWNDIIVKEITQFFHIEKEKENNGTLHNIHMKYGYIFGAMSVAILTNMPASMAIELSVDSFVSSLLVIFSSMALILCSLNRLFSELNIVLCNNILDLMSAEDNTGLIIPKESILRSRNHTKLLKADLVFIAFLKKQQTSKLN